MAWSPGFSRSGEPPKGGTPSRIGRRCAKIPNRFLASDPVAAIRKSATIITVAFAVCLAGCDRPDAHTAASVEQPLTVSTPDQVLYAATTSNDPFGASPLAKLAVLERLSDSLETAPPELRGASAAITEFARDGDLAALRRLGAPTVASLAGHLVSRMSLDEFSELAGASLRVSFGPIATQEEAVDRVLEAFDAITGNGTPASQPSALIMTDGCDPDGRVTGQTHVMPAGAPRVYAVFENDRSLAGRRDVYAVWRDPTNDRLVFTETEPIHPGSHYNFLWLELAEGWPAGRYCVELYDPARPSQLLASEGFLVR